jgi:hypothetical protein
MDTREEMLLMSVVELEGEVGALKTTDDDNLLTTE